MSGCFDSEKTCKHGVIFGHISSFCYQCTNERIKKLESKVENIPMIRGDNGACYEMENICNSIDKLEEKIKRILKGDMQNENRPFKCPVCDGSANHPDQTPRLMVNVHTKTGIIVCNACEGKGIVWG